MPAVPAKVLRMNLEARVTTVEEGLTAVREVELPAYRADMERNDNDLRAETRGWATVAVQAANKVEAGKDILNLIYQGGREMQKDIAVLQVDMAKVKTDVAGLKTDVSVLKTDVSVLKTDVSVLKTDVSELKSDMAEVKSDVAFLKTGQERQEKRLDGIDAVLREILAKVA
jgi:chromosome segregation ATPase